MQNNAWDTFNKDGFWLLLLWLLLYNKVIKLHVGPVGSEKNMRAILAIYFSVYGLVFFSISLFVIGEIELHAIVRISW